jgi:hypothetical protein
MAFESADCQSNAYLSRSLGYGQKHEVRDSDAADQQADGGDGAHLQRGSAVSCPSLSTIDKPIIRVECLPYFAKYWSTPFMVKSFG